MSMPHIDATALETLRELLGRLDPDSELLVDEDSGEVLVRGDIDPEQLDAAIRKSGLDMRALDAAGAGCCGGCGCGCG